MWHTHICSVSCLIYANLTQLFSKGGWQHSGNIFWMSLLPCSKIHAFPISRQRNDERSQTLAASGLRHLLHVLAHWVLKGTWGFSSLFYGFSPNLSRSLEERNPCCIFREAIILLLCTKKKKPGKTWSLPAKGMLE